MYKLINFCPHVEIKLCVIGWLVNRKKNIWSKDLFRKIKFQILGPILLFLKRYAFRNNWVNVYALWRYMALPSVHLFYFCSYSFKYWELEQVYLWMRREEKPTRCNWLVYCTYNMLNMFRALLCPSSGARHYMCVITAYVVRCLGCWLSEVRCRAAGYAFGIRDVARTTSLITNE